MALRRNYDPWLFVVGALLLLGGLLVAGSSTSFVSMRTQQDPSALFLRRGIHTAMALLALYLAMNIPYRHLAGRRFLQAFFWVCFAMLVAVFFFPDQGGAHRWILIPPIRFQPSELAKLFAILYVAARLSRSDLSIDSFREAVRPPLIVVGSLAALVLAEPDLGSTAVLVGLPAIMLFMAGLHRRLVTRASVFGAMGLVLALIVARYRFKRVREWLEWVFGISDPPFQLDQSFLAIGNGGWFGVGPGQSIQKAFYLPAAHTDFVFSIIGEEWGLLGTLGVLAAFLLIFARGIRTWRRTSDPFGAHLALGLTCLIVGQALLHMSVCLGLLPTTGLTLPLMGYGGSSLISSATALGLLINVSQGCNLSSPGKPAS